MDRHFVASKQRVHNRGVPPETNHRFAIEYGARLLRFTTKHHGPVRDSHINEWLKRDALTEFMGFLRQ